MTSQLTKKQLFVLGLGGVLSLRNQEAFDDLHPTRSGKGDSVEKQREMLQSMWGVVDVPSLIEALVGLLVYGHRAQYAREAGHPPLAWDHGRYVNVVRWAYACEYIDEKMAWKLLDAVVDPVLNTYDSWGSFIRDFVIGRTAWNGKPDAATEHAAMALFMPSYATKSPCLLVPWPERRERVTP